MGKERDKSAFLKEHFFVIRFIHYSRKKHRLLIITTIREITYAREASEPFAASDHNLIRCILGINMKMSCISTFIPNYGKTNFTDLRRELGYVNWKRLLDVTRADETYCKFKPS